MPSDITTDSFQSFRARFPDVFPRLSDIGLTHLRALYAELQAQCANDDDAADAALAIVFGFYLFGTINGADPNVQTVMLQNINLTLRLAGYSITPIAMTTH